ncbi:MAG: hypothetical protein IJ190_02535 [Prevotella sp.]|nr:hypothetical protein [Prevotella sp.]
MKKYMLVLSSLLMLAVLSTGCSNSDEGQVYDLSTQDLALNNRTDMKAVLPFSADEPSVKIALKQKSMLPDWLVSKINTWEKDDPTKSTAVYSGEWEGKTFIYFYNSLLSSLLNLYDADGNPFSAFSWEENGGFEKFFQTSSHWELNYCTDVNKYILPVDEANL